MFSGDLFSGDCKLPEESNSGLGDYDFLPGSHNGDSNFLAAEIFTTKLEDITGDISDNFLNFLLPEEEETPKALEDHNYFLTTDKMFNSGVKDFNYSVSGIDSESSVIDEGSPKQEDWFKEKDAIVPHSLLDSATCSIKTEFLSSVIIKEDPDGDWLSHVKPEREEIVPHPLLGVASCSTKREFPNCIIVKEDPDGDWLSHVKPEREEIVPHPLLGVASCSTKREFPNCIIVKEDPDGDWLSHVKPEREEIVPHALLGVASCSTKREFPNCIIVKEDPDGDSSSVEETDNEVDVVNVYEKFPELIIGEGENSGRRGQGRRRGQSRGRGRGRGRGRSAQNNVVNVNTPHKEGLAAQNVGRGFSKKISTGAASGSQSSVPGPSNWNGGGKPRMLFQNWRCNSNSESYSTRGSSEQLDQIDPREKHNLSERERRNKLRELFWELRLLVPELRNKPDASKVQILTSAREYVNKLEEERLQQVKCYKDKHKCLRREVRELIKSLEDLYNNRLIN